MLDPVQCQQRLTLGFFLFLNPLSFSRLLQWAYIIMMSHRNVEPHVSINEVACYRTERMLMGCTNSLLI